MGGFALARILTARGLRIVCYHGISLEDEHFFQPKLFIREEIFRKRMRYLRRHHYTVLLLDEALKLLDDSALPPRAVVITFDDGWTGLGAKAAPILKEYEFPSTLYVTTSDVISEAPVFDVALRYLLWKGRGSSLNMSFLGAASETVALKSAAQREQIARHITEIGISQCCDQKKLLMKVAEALGVDWNPTKNHLFRLMTVDELAQLPSRGMDLQLHTHHHRFPFDCRKAAEREIIDNRTALEPIVDKPLVHFCYPSGEFDVAQFPWLRDLGIESATTCLSGFNYPSTERLELRRFLDGENLTQIEFEAELSGLLELMRQLRGAWQGGSRR